MTDLHTELVEAENKVAQLKRRIAGAGCDEVGHDWKHIGGRNAGCDRDGCHCSIPVHECTKCGGCDYGENDEARGTVEACARNSLELINGWDAA